MTIAQVPRAAIRAPRRHLDLSGDASLVLGVLFFFACLTGVPAILLGRRALSDIQRSGGRLRGKGMAIAGIVLGVIGCLFTVSLFLPAVRSAREAARRSQCVNNLKQIGLGFHNYHSSNDCLPAAAITDKDGRPLLSWRVAMLPYIESSPLYSKFHLDEPWDSPHNLSLLEPTPLVYACPSDMTRKPGRPVIKSSSAPRRPSRRTSNRYHSRTSPTVSATPPRQRIAPAASPGPSPKTYPST